MLHPLLKDGWRTIVLSPPGPPAYVEVSTCRVVDLRYEPLPSYSLFQGVIGRTPTARGSLLDHR